MPVFEGLAGRVSVPLSIDTMKPGVARAALDMLYQRKSRVLGLVFNSVRATSGDYYYYHRYSDYYKS